MKIHIRKFSLGRFVQLVSMLNPQSNEILNLSCTFRHSLNFGGSFAYSRRTNQFFMGKNYLKVIFIQFFNWQNRWTQAEETLNALGDKMPMVLIG